MKGILSVVVVCLIAKFTDAQITGWTITDFTLSTGVTNGKIVSMSKTASVSEGHAAGTAIMTLTATPTTANAAITYAFATSGNPDSVGVFDGTTANQINLATGKSFNYETSKSIVFIVTATETGQTAAEKIGTATVTVNIKNKLEFSKAKFGLCANDGLAAGSVIATFAVADAQTGETVAYGGVTNVDLEYVAATGVLKVASGKTLKMATTNSYTLALTATGTVTTGTASDAGSAAVVIAVCDPSGAAKVSAVVGAMLLSIVASVFI